MNFAVVGGRRFNDYEKLNRRVGAIILQYHAQAAPERPVIVSGGATGADTLAERFAAAHELRTSIHLPDYEQHGRVAPIVRNAEIVAEADVVIAFWDGVSRGTKNTIKQAKLNGKPVHVVSY